MYQALKEPDHQSPVGFGLLLILNDIGDPKKTLKGKGLWLKGKTLISRNPGGEGYRVWEFSCGTRRERHAHVTYFGGVSNTGEEIRKIVSTDKPEIEKLFDILRQRQGAVIIRKHTEGKDLQDVSQYYWPQSKTGEVNVTEFRPKTASVLL